MIRLTFSFRHLMLALEARSDTSNGSTESVLRQARAELDDLGATSVTIVRPGTLRFNRRIGALGRSWMVYLSGGEVSASRSGREVILILRASLVPLTAVASAFSLLFALLHMPLAVNLGLIAFFVGGNAIFAILGLRGIARRALGHHPTGKT